MKGRFKVLLLDMNDTFMFSGDRFGDGEDYYIYYENLGGNLTRNHVNELISKVYDYLLERYPDPLYRESFPSLHEAFKEVSKEVSKEDLFEPAELELLQNTFAFHELGKIPQEYSEAIRSLSEQYSIGLVADIWSPKRLWIEEFKRAQILDSFDVVVFSSDSSTVKPSHKPFLNALDQIDAEPGDAVIVGDSPRRDLGGALAAGLPCVLVEGKTHPMAYGIASDFREFAKDIL